MAITRDRVTLSQVDFNIAKYDYTDNVPYRGVYFDGPYNTFADLAGIQRNNVYLQMLLFGISEMNLYDHEQNVIGYLKMENFTYEYVTYQLYRIPGSGDTIWTEEQVDSAICPMYRSDDQYHEYFAGVQFRRVVGTDGQGNIHYIMNLNGETKRITYLTEACVNIYDWYGSFPVRYVSDVVNLYRIPSVGLMTRTRQGETHTYLNWTEIDYTYNITWDEYVGDGVVYCGMIGKDTDLLADNLNITDYIVTEEGFMNEISDRFSPRFNSNGVGLYLIPAENSQTDPSHLGDIEDIMRMMQEYDLGDNLIKSWVGTDGKEYVMGIRWYYGLAKPNVWKSTTDQKFKLQIGPITPDEALHYYYDYVFTSEFASFSTSELTVPAHFNNYLDFACSYKLYLPYYGFMDIDPNDIVGGTIRVHYNINLFSGAATILVECKNSRTGNLAMKAYTVDCTVGEDIPFTYDMYKSFGVQAAEKGAWAAKTLANGAAGAYGAAANKAAADANLNTEITRMTNNNLIRNEGVSQAQAAAYSASGGKGMTANDFHKQFDASLTQETINTMETNQRTANQANYNNQMAQTANNIVQQNMPLSVFTPGRSSGSSDETGSMDELFPYLLITRPVNVEPIDYEDYGGIPSSDSVTLNMCNGFTQIRAVHPDTMQNAPKYINEIISQLQAGVYL